MRGKKNLEKAIVMGLLLSTSVYGTAWAEDKPDIYYHGGVNGHGNTVLGTIPVGNINGIDIIADGLKDNTIWADTTEAIIFSNNSYNITGNVTIINTVQNEIIDNNGALYVKSNADVTINGGDNEIIIAAIGGSEERNNSTAISAKTPLGDLINRGWEALNDKNTVTVSGNNVKIIGDLDNSEGLGDNTINLDISSSNSFWYGNVIESKEKINITLSEGAEWIYDEYSTLYNLTLNDGIVNLQDNDIQNKLADDNIKTILNGYNLADYSSKDAHKKVSIKDLKGTGGIFKVDLDWDTNKGLDGLGQKKETENSDYIYIEKSAEDSMQTLDFDASKANLDKMNVGDKLYFANVEDGNTSFTTTMGDTINSNNSSNIYNYQYGVGSDVEDDGTNADWYIGLTGKTVEGNANYESAKGAMYAGYALGTELDTLNKRMGEARYLEDDNGVWVRYRHAKTGWDDTFETNSDMFQLGFDNEVQEDDGTHYRGVAVDYTDADTSLMHARGDGENKRYAVSLYDTWIGGAGHYRDLVLRGGRINSDYDISGMFDSGMEDIGGDYHQWFGSISAEWGRKNDMQSGWYFEPQTQLQLARVGGASYVSDSGIAVDQDGATSLIGRVGFRLGREYEKDNGKTDNYYFKADLMHEFMGDKGIALSTATERYTDEYDGQETWFDIGLGADISIGKNSFFWADVERTLGADFDNTWQVNGGFRWEF